MSNTIGEASSAEEKRRRLEQLLKQKATRATRFPLSFAQHRLWFLYQFDPASPLYNLPVALRLSGPLRVEALERTLEEVVRRHEILRTTFQAVAGEPVQVIAPPGPWRLEAEDLSGLGGAEREAEVRRRVRADVLRPFDLAAGPPLRAALLRCGPEEHVLLLCVHHIVSDGWSMQVLFREMGALYGAYLRGEPSPLPELPIQYADFTLWQRERLRGPLLERQLEYWKEQLRDAPAVLELPTDRPRPAAQSFRGSMVPFALEAATTQRLQALARREGATLFMLLLAASQLLLSRYAGTEDVVVGTPVAGRTRQETEALIGLFINTLALRADLSGDPAFTGLLARVKEGLLEAQAHQELPFEKLVGELHAERSLSHAPVFQVLVSMEGIPRAFDLGGVPAVPIPGETETAKFDLWLVLQEEAGAITGLLEYATDLFDRATAARMTEHLRTLLEGILAGPERRVSELPLLSLPERRQLLEEWSRTEWAPAPERTLHALFAERAGEDPDRVAVECGGQRWSYEELERRSNRLAHHLRGLGVGPEAPVGICVERSAEMVAAVLGILKAGGAYLPLDPAYPPERLGYMLADSGAAVLVTQERLREALPEFGGVVVRLDADAPAIARQPDEAPPDGVDPSGLAYVIYTSGSTGRPKGVMVPHAGVASFLRSMRRAPGLDAGDVLVAVTTLSFDIAALELFLPLTTGARLVVATREQASDGIALAELMERCGATVVQATPATWRMLVQSGWMGRRALRVICGGEALPRELAVELRARSRELWNLYGPTETTIWSTLHPVDGDGPATVPLGRPILNTRVYVLDGRLHPVPVGVPGSCTWAGSG